MASLVLAPGRGTSTACSRKSGISRSRSSRPPLACGLAPMRRSPSGASAASSGRRAPPCVEQLLGSVGAQPFLELAQVLGVALQIGERNLVGAKRALRGQPVDDLRAGPALRRAQHDHRPARTLLLAARAGALLDRADLRRDVVERRGHQLVHLPRVRALDEPGGVAVALEQRAQLGLGNAREHGRVGDLVAVEVQHRQHRAVADGVQELVRVPAGRQRAGFRLAVADDAADEQVGIVERGAVGVHERVAELAALVDRAGRLGGDVAGDPAGERELAEQAAQALLVVADVRVELAVGALEVHVRDQPRAAVARAGDVDRVEVALAYHAVQVRVDEVQARRRAPMAEQARLGVLDPQRLAQQRVLQQVDLAHRQVVGGAPVGVEQLQLGRSQRSGCACRGFAVDHETSSVTSVLP